MYNFQSHKTWLYINQERIRCCAQEGEFSFGFFLWEHIRTYMLVVERKLSSFFVKSNWGRWIGINSSIHKRKR